MILNYISLPIFIISLAVGLLFVYIWGPETKTVLIYPNPENVEKVLFKDNADNCFHFTPVEVDCSEDITITSIIPIQA